MLTDSRVSSKEGGAGEASPPNSSISPPPPPPPPPPSQDIANFRITNTLLGFKHFWLHSAWEGAHPPPPHHGLTATCSMSFPSKVKFLDETLDSVVLVIGGSNHDTRPGPLCCDLSHAPWTGKLTLSKLII